MSVEIYNGERSEESIQFEKLLTSESNKKSFSSIENTEQFVKQMGTESHLLLGTMFNFQIMLRSKHSRACRFSH